MNDGDKGIGKLCAELGNSPPALEGAKYIFDDVPDTVYDGMLTAHYGY